MTRDSSVPLVRPATPADGPRYLELVRGLAEFEQLEPPDAAASRRLLEHAFGPRPRYELLVGELQGSVEGYAVFFETYSTFRALPSLYLEDVFVHAGSRGQGLGSAFLRHLARLALERGCGRLDGCVLDWNVGAQRFYRSLGAKILTQWQPCRVEGAALLELGRPAPPRSRRAPQT